MVQLSGSCETFVKSVRAFFGSIALTLGRHCGTSGARSCVTISVEAPVSNLHDPELRAQGGHQPNSATMK
jgi:hypothetical protein